jgi:hypothetical protein
MCRNVGPPLQIRSCVRLGHPLAPWWMPGSAGTAAVVVVLWLCAVCGGHSAGKTTAGLYFLESANSLPHAYNLCYRVSCTVAVWHWVLTSVCSVLAHARQPGAGEVMDTSDGVAQTMQPEKSVCAHQPGCPVI